MQIRLSHLALAATALMGILPSTSALPTELNRRVAAGHYRRVIDSGLVRRSENATGILESTATETATEEVATDTATETATATSSIIYETATATDSVTATTTSDFASATETSFFHGTSPIDQAVFPTINSWDTCNDFLRSNGINLFPNSFNSFDVFIQEVTVIQILIDDRGRARRRRTFNYFPPPQSYFSEFDLSIQQNNIVQIDANGFSSGSFDSNIGFDDKFDNRGKGKNKNKNKSSNGISSDDINHLVKSIIS